MEFVEDLLKFNRNPALLPVDKPVGGGGDTLAFSDGTVDAELKASAPLFVPVRLVGQEEKNDGRFHKSDWVYFIAAL
jgi:hypothetical protein